jgi:type I restriction enzyme S subunit
MQALLTPPGQPGHQRLPGFTGAWEARRLGDVAEIRSGGTPATGDARYWNGSILWCTPTDITELRGKKYLIQTERTISQLGLESSSAELIPAHSIVLTSRATIGECAINQYPVTTNQGFKNLVPTDGVDVEFLFYFMQTQKPGLIRLCGGSTFLEIGKMQLSSYSISLPSLPEQAAIAAVLSDLDAEVEALEAKLAKARQIKQGMMQELLTGRVRLV